jgi:hypothetical protein
VIFITRYDLQRSYLGSFDGLGVYTFNFCSEMMFFLVEWIDDHLLGIPLMIMELATLSWC